MSISFTTVMNGGKVKDTESLSPLFKIREKKALKENSEKMDFNYLEGRIYLLSFLSRFNNKRVDDSNSPNNPPFINLPSTSKTCLCPPTAVLCI